eukprot:TRINITY_DN3446_c0_g1_i3.p1 TRINITY_DN3446_c0_g1~~TRINITY_DN3446_c0_g1_i3.p1  ORF type:complete len:120 (-),score=13.03 TRINITY_DN3446_c0_g1_i3:28-387(-)
MTMFARLKKALSRIPEKISSKPHRTVSDEAIVPSEEDDYPPDPDVVRLEALPPALPFLYNSSVMKIKNFSRQDLDTIKKSKLEFVDSKEPLLICKELCHYTNLFSVKIDKRQNLSLIHI